MEENLSLPQRFLGFIKDNLLISALFLIGLICLLIGLIQYFSPSEKVIEFQAGQEVKAAETENQEGKVFIDVSGEVNNPNLYEFKTGARVKDAIDKAGGFTGQADTEYVSKNINMALLLSDGMKIYIPKDGEDVVIQGVGLAHTTQQAEVPSGLISINTASASELESLPGVGPVTAQKIMDGRPYGNLDELIEKKAVGQSLYSKIKEKLTL